MFVTGLQKTVVWVPSYPGERPPRPVDPDWGVEGPADPGWGVPEGGRPDQGLPGWAWPERPGHGLPWPGYPGRPGHGLPRPERPADPGWGVDEGAGIGGGPVIPGYPGQGLPGYPGRPGHGLPWNPPGRPSRGYPMVPAGDLGGHPAGLPDLNMPGHWGGVHYPKSAVNYPAWILSAEEPPQVEEGYEPRHPPYGAPGSWVTVLVDSDTLAWAWVLSPPQREDIEPED